MSLRASNIHLQIPVPPIHSPPVGSPLHLYAFYIQCSPLSGYPLRKLSLCNYCYTTPAYPYMAIGAAPRAQGSWGCVRTAYLSDYSTEIFISWPKNMPDVPNVHARQTRLPRCKCDQHRRRRRRWYPNATVAVRHAEPLGSVAACAVFSSNLSKCSKLLHSIPHLPSKVFEKS